ncbi:hypothetical protein [Pedobacter sp. L105]|uniref:hypothetical protein n=1 Tax=Pedobacter sp. L105 TaxID=1641871 RepID=UPI00131AF0CB|nr:hypothetical protein [Pedobacter sp. L105]
MITIENLPALSPESLYDILKKEFADYINAALDANLSIEYAHVADVINIHFPEIIEEIVFTLTISDDNIEIVNLATEGNYNTELLEENLIEFITVKAG